MKRNYTIAYATCGLGILVSSALVVLGCAHNSFERCVRDRELAALDAKVQAAVACQGDQECLVTQGLGSIGNYYENVRVCKAAATGQADGGTD